MTFIEIICALVIFGLFMFGFSQAFFPLYNAWETALEEYRIAHTIRFIAESFEHECKRPDRNLERWKSAVAAAKELESYEITELKQGDELRAFRLTCIVSGEALEVIGVCAP